MNIYKNKKIVEAGLVNLQPRIQKLINTANECKGKGIDICAFKEGKNCIKLMGEKNCLIHHMGIESGLFGTTIFKINGTDIFARKKDTAVTCPLRINHMVKFLLDFDNFEKLFYAYVEVEGN